MSRVGPGQLGQLGERGELVCSLPVQGKQLRALLEGGIQRIQHLLAHREDPLGRPVDEVVTDVVKEFVVGGEVVTDGAAREPGLRDHSSHTGRGYPVAGDHPERGLGDLVASLLMVDMLRHDFVLAHSFCYRGFDTTVLRRGARVQSLVTLAGLALLDSLSIGTLFIPVLMLLRPQVQWSRLVVYCVSLGAFYLVLGVALLAGAQAAMDRFALALQSTPMLWIQLIVGGAFLAYGLFGWPASKERSDSETSPWEKRLSRPLSISATIGLAVAAGAIEVATMAPYLAAIGMLTVSSLDLSVRVLLLGGYCALMFTPAIILALARLSGGSRLDSALSRFKDWLNRQIQASTPWVVGAIGFFVAGSAAGQLF